MFVFQRREAAPPGCHLEHGSRGNAALETKVSVGPILETMQLAKARPRSIALAKLSLMR
jgi:hypothetical protein